jgi:hypothetical protein
MFGMSNFASKLLGKRRSAVNREEGAPARAMAERTVALGQVWSQVSQQINERDPEDWNLWHWLQDLYYDAGELFAVTISAGRLYRWPVTVVGDLVTLGDPVAVVVEFAESSERVIERVATRPPGLLSRAVRQTRDGRWIGCSILCTATVNKMGILDSRQLFDSFVERFVGDGTEYINVLHLGGGQSRIGSLRHVWREDKLLVGIYEFTPGDAVAEACARTLAEDTEGFWGGSIEFQHIGQPLLVEVADGIRLPMTHDGQLLGYSIARNQDCAAWYTGNLVMERSMTEKDRAVALALLGDEALVDELAARLDESNRALAGAVTRTVAAEVPSEQPQAMGAEGSEPEIEADEPIVYELEPEAMAQIAEAVVAHRAIAERFGHVDQAVEARMNGLLERLEALAGELAQQTTMLSERLAKLEQDEQTRYRQYDAEKPKQPTVKFGVRPRERRPDGMPDVMQESGFARKARERRTKTG